MIAVARSVALVGLLSASLQAGEQGSTEVVAMAGEWQATSDEVQAWCRRKRRNCVSFVQRRVAVEDMVVQHELESRFAALGLESRDLSHSLELQDLLLADGLVRRAVRGGIPQPAEQVLREFHESDLARWRRPKKWRLRNIFLRFSSPSEESKSQVRARLEALRERAALGEDFGALAKQYSESQTRLRSGAMGMIPLERLASSFRTAVEPLKSGQMSALIEGPSGMTLLLAEDVQAAGDGSFESARTQVEVAWRKVELARRLEAVDERIHEELKPRVHSQMRGGQFSGALIEWGPADGRRALSNAAINYFLERKRIDLRSADQVDAALEARFMLEGYRWEASNLGLLQSPELEQKKRAAAAEARAQAAANHLSQPWIREPTLEQLKERYHQREDSLLRPRRRKTVQLKLKIEQNRLAGFYEEVRQAGVLASSGQLSFEKLVERYTPFAELKEASWLTDRQLWLQGLNVDRAVRELDVGEMTPWVQEGRVLILTLLEATEEQRTMTFDEARAMLRAELLNRSTRAAGQRLRDSILDEIGFRHVETEGRRE